jgi:hypothetical protein
LHLRPRTNPQHQRHIQGPKVRRSFRAGSGIDGGDGHLTKIYSDGEDIFQSANQFIAYHRRLAPPRSQMRQKANIIMKTNPGMKASNKWLHGMGFTNQIYGSTF